MMELPEAATLARQLNESAKGRRITAVIAASSPHKFAWFHGDPQRYPARLKGKTIGEAQAFGGLVEIKLGNTLLIFGDGVGLRLHVDQTSLPKKHQLLITFEDSTALSASVQMYGGLWCCEDGSFDNPYYGQAKQKPSPLAKTFAEQYFGSLVDAQELQNKSVKAFCATEQRIPGLGNGVLQDILFAAKLNPRRKLETLSSDMKKDLYRSVKKVLRDMTAGGGRDTEKDLHGNYGGYATGFCKKTAGSACPDCGSPITKANYMGGSVYYCATCQTL